MKEFDPGKGQDLRTLEWYLRFLNTPISQLRTRGELVDFYDYFGQFVFGELFYVTSQPDTRPDAKRFEKFRKCCRIIFTAIWNKRKASSGFIGISKIYRYLVLAQILNNKETAQAISTSFLVQVVSNGKSATVRKIPFVNWNAEFDILFINTLIIATIDFLKPYDLLRFQKCAKKECRKFFYQRTKRPKKYCSPRCAGTVRQRRFQEDKKKQNNPNESYLVGCPGNLNERMIVEITATECINPNGRNVRGLFEPCPNKRNACPHLKKERENEV